MITAYTIRVFMNQKDQLICEKCAKAQPVADIREVQDPDDEMEFKCGICGWWYGVSS